MEACQSVDVGGVAGKLGDAETSSCESDSFEKIVQPDYEQVCPAWWEGAGPHGN